jgi:hypothetical protein
LATANAGARLHLDVEPARAEHGLTGDMRSGDRVAQRHVTEAVEAVGAGVAFLANRRVELQELALECLHVGDRVHGPPRVGPVLFTALDRKLTREAAQIRRRESQCHAGVEAVERELLAVSRDTGEIDPREMAIDVSEREAQIDQPGGQLGVLDGVGLSERPAQRVQLVHQVVEQHPAVAVASLFIRIRERACHPPLVRLLERRDNLRWPWYRGRERIVLDVGTER